MRLPCPHWYIIIESYLHFTFYSLSESRFRWHRHTDHRFKKNDVHWCETLRLHEIFANRINSVKWCESHACTNTNANANTHKPKKLTLCCVHASVTSSNHYFCVKCFIDYRSTFRRSFIVFNDFLQNNRLFQLISLFFFFARLHWQIFTHKMNIYTVRQT